jgi:hypothetical protein
VCAVFRFNADALIVAADFYWDQLTMLAQLGQQAVVDEMAMQTVSSPAAG